MTIGSIEKVFIEDLTPLYGANEAASLALLSIEFICQVNRTEYLGAKNDQLTEHELTALHRVLTELKKSIPIQYVLGETEFYGLTFKVNPAVLIPRPETEELVDWVLKDIKNLKISAQDLKIMDIGTGSGCIPISIKNNLPDAEVYGLDISKMALDTAQTNAELNKASVAFIQQDILNDDHSDHKLSIIVSNPPYVTLTEKAEMHSNVLDNEPHLALFVPDEDPLKFYNAIADFAIKHLQHPGFLYLEINENLGQKTVQLLKGKGFNAIQLKKDLRDKDRMIRAQLNII